MKKILYILLLQLLFSENFQSIGVFTNNSNSFETIALSGATTAWVKDVSSIGSNPAGLSKMEGLNFDLGLSTESENVDNYSDSQFPYLAIGYGLPIKKYNLNLGFGISYQARTVNDLEGWDFGQNYQGLFNFSESAISMAMAINFQPVSFGFKWVQYTQNFDTYGSQRSKEFIKPIAFGIQYKLTKKLNFGLSILKPSQVGEYDYSISQSTAGVSWSIDDKNLVAIDYEKLSNNNGGMSIGYLRKMNLVSLGIGLKHIVVEEESHSQFSTGLSFKIKSINLNLALKQNISSDILNPYSRILHCSISYKY